MSLLACSCPALAMSAQPYSFVIDFELPNAAVLNIAPTGTFPGSDSSTLLATTFAGFGKTPSAYIPDLASVVERGAAGPPPDVVQLEDSAVWSNEIEMVPSGAVSGLPASVLTAGGFLVPGKSTGSIDLWDVSVRPAQNTQLSTDKKGWFYHHTEWHDMNGDGRLDLLAARATTSSMSANATGAGLPKMTAGVSGSGELLWLEQPATGAASGHWQEHVLVSGPDVAFVFDDIDGDGRRELIATQFFSAPELAIYTCPHATTTSASAEGLRSTPSDDWTGCNASNIERHVIDGAVDGPWFACQLADMNADGKTDLLVTNNRADGKGGLFVFEQPVDGSLATGNWTRHELAAGFKPIKQLVPSPGRGSPGNAQAFHPTTSATSAAGKPHVLMSGDDGGFVALLEAAAPHDASDWSYSIRYLANSTGTIGSPAVGDVDGDGVVEVLVPFYSEGRVEVYTMQGTPPPPPASACVACLLKKDPVGLSPDSEWCAVDGQCHLVGSPQSPCATQQCSSAAKTSRCKCTSCNDAACSRHSNFSTSTKH